MIHGPCGRAFSKSPCMKDGYCTKYYPKTFSRTTVIDDSGYPSYRRRDTGAVTEKKGVHMDNRNVVPYNAYLLISYQAHVNLEYCNKSNAIKYLFKYVNKGPDRVAVGVTKETSSGEDAQVIDEIKQFYDCRYLSACEAVWRTLAYDIHQRWPSVMRLTFHLPGEQNIIFKDDDDLEEIVEEEEGKCDIYYMRILLAVHRGCTTYKSIRTVNGITYSSFQDACYSMGLLCDDREFIAAINEVAELASGGQLRKLFAMLLISNSISNPERVWNATWTLLADGILYERRKALKYQGVNVTDDELKNLCLIEIEKILNNNARSLRDYQSMPYPVMSDVCLFQNKLIEEELAYHTNELTHTNLYTEQKMTHEQRLVFDEILNAVITDSGGFYFVHGHGGCGKTFIWNGLSSAIRSRGKIVLNVTSSGIASLLLPGGRMAHSRFSMPITITDESTCNIKHGSLKAELLIQSSLIIWDEAPMLNKITVVALCHHFALLLKALLFFKFCWGSLANYGKGTNLRVYSATDILPYLNWINSFSLSFHTAHGKYFL
ncbi:uncharacterized protein [Arachis hypogaea]|uniref:uncharacterized protein n=1 Tax=Arachis hypogaea TaxID=3818 RepID=UPI003B222502